MAESHKQRSLGQRPTQLGSGHFLLLPYIEQNALYSNANGISNTVLTVERQAACYGNDFPRAGQTPSLGTGSFTFSIWARGGRHATFSPWIDGAPGAADLTLNNGTATEVNAGYTWWDCPVINAMLRNPANFAAGPGPRTDPTFRNPINGVPNFFSGKQIFNAVEQDMVIEPGQKITKEIVVPESAGQNVKHIPTADF